MSKKKIVQDERKGGEQESEIGIKIGEKERDFVTTMDQNISLAYDNTHTRRDRNALFYKRRYGVTGGTKTWPWVGASNLPINFTDEMVNKLKGKFMAHMWGNNIIANFEPGNPDENDDVRIEKCEAFFDFLVKRRMRPYRDSEIAVDSMLQKGHSFIKVVYEKVTETVTSTFNYDEFPDDVKMQVLENKNVTIDKKLMAVMAQFRIEKDIADKVLDKIIMGERGKITVTIKEYDTYDAPKWVVCEEEDIVVPEGTTSLQEAEWICHKGLWLTERQLQARADSGKYNKSAVEKIIENKAAKKQSNSTNYTTEQSTRDTREGVQNVGGDEEGRYNLYEVCCYYDLDGDGRPEKAILTYCPDFPDTPLRFGYFPYEIWPLRWNYVELSYEYTCDRFYSPRGVCEILDPIQAEMEIQHNQKIDHQTIVNTPMFKVKRGGGTVPNAVRFTPGEQVFVDDTLNDWQPIYQPSREMSYEREEQILRRMGESRIGVFDSTLMNEQSSSSRRTAREISKIDMSENQQFNADAMRFQMALADLYYLTYALWIQWGPIEVYVRWGGEDEDKQEQGQMPMQQGMPQQGQMMPMQQGPQTPTFSWIKGGSKGTGKIGTLITKRDITGMWDIVPSTDLNKSAYAERQEAVFLYQMLAGNPMVDQRKLLRRVLSKVNWQLVSDLLKTEQQIQQEQGAPQYDQYQQGAQNAKAGGAMQQSPMENLG